MKRRYILIDNEKLKLSNWRKWLMLIAISYLCLIVISTIESLISNIMNVNIANIMLVTVYIRAFIVLSLIRDLAPRFKKVISILWTILVSFIYIGIDSRAGDNLYLGATLFLILVITYNIVLYKKPSNFKSTKNMS